MTRKPLRRYRTGMPIGPARKTGMWTVDRRLTLTPPHEWETVSLHRGGAEARAAKAALEAEHGEFVP